MNMPLNPTWTDIAIRLALTMMAGAIIGLNRGARGHAAGFRTTILVALAAAVAMIQANIDIVAGRSDRPLPGRWAAHSRNRRSGSRGDHVVDPQMGRRDDPARA